MDVQQWLDKHPTWGKGTRRIAVQGLKRALNYAVSMQITPRNPIKGFKISLGGKRISFFTPEVEAQLLSSAFRGAADGHHGLRPHRRPVWERIRPVDRRPRGRDSQGHAVEVFVG